jgi:hypothetical protein
MAKTSIEQISQYLNKLNIQHDVKHEHDLIISKIAGTNSIYTFGFALQESSNTFVMLTPYLAKAMPGVNMPESHLPTVMELLLDINYKLALGAFERNRSDGEIRFTISVPTEDSSPTEAQMLHLLAACLFSVDTYYPAIQAAIYAGEHLPVPVPGPGDPTIPRL